MRVTEGIQIDAIHVVAVSVETYREVATLAGHLEEAFAAGDVHDRGLRQGDWFRRGAASEKQQAGRGGSEEGSSGCVHS